MAEAYVLVINCGSSSIKLALIEPQTADAPWQALAERLGTAEAELTVKTKDGDKRTIALAHAQHEPALEKALGELPDRPLAAIGHRVVHGGETFRDSVLLDARAIAAIEAVSDLAELHNPANLLGIRAGKKLRPDLGQVAVFDTAFHHTLPPHAFHYALPYALYEKHKLRRYGFHGTSHQYVGGRAAELLQRPFAELNLITAHLGNGASAAAIQHGRSVDTTMGLTPLEGVAMGSRSGDVDPNLHEYLVNHAGLTLAQVGDLLNKQSGLLGLSGETNDMRKLLELERSGHARAKLAIDVFCYRLAKGLLAMSAALPAIDALVFTGGIGENAAPVRARTAAWLRVLGIALDPKLNDDHGKHSNGTISASSSRVRVLVVPTQEELVIAREALRLVQADPKS